MARQIKNWIIFYVARWAIFVAGWIPAGWGKSAGRGIGALAWRLARYERRLAERQLATAFGRKISTARARLIVQGVFRHLGQNAVELCRLNRCPRQPPLVEVSPDALRILRRGIERKKGIVYVTAHLGNWELMAQTLARLGFPISTVAKSSYDSRFTRLIDGFRRRGGVQSIYRGSPGASAKMLRILRRGEVLGLLIDQDTRVPGTFVPFFGLPAYTPVGAATLACRTGATVVVGTIYRTVRGGHRLVIEECAIPEETSAGTAVLTANLESRIRRHPSQWVWFHQRWKTRPEIKKAA